jgi:hypothetical protein
LIRLPGSPPFRPNPLYLLGLGELDPRPEFALASPGLTLRTGDPSRLVYACGLYNIAWQAVGIS